jgi:hypothetical protein
MPVRLVRSCITVKGRLRICYVIVPEMDDAKFTCFDSTRHQCIRANEKNELLHLAVNIKNDPIIIMKVSCWVCAPSLSHS